MNAPPTRIGATAFALFDLERDLARARTICPECADAYATLLAHLGDLAAALVDHKFDRRPARGVRAKALHVAASAIRVGTEGDADYRLAPAADIATATAGILAHACERIDQLRLISPDNSYTLARLSKSVAKIGEYLVQDARTWQVSALESSVVHAVAWALRVAIEGDAAFPYAPSAEWHG